MADRRRMGVMGGTFDPIHYGHLVAAESARATFRLERVIFVPAGQPPHKPAEAVTAAEHRYAMTVLATASNPYFTVSRLEIDRPGPSYTVDTINQLHAAWGPGVAWYFITGADAMLEILGWKQSAALLRSCEFVAATRPGTPTARLRAAVKALEREHGPRFHSIVVPGVATSSSEVRARVRRGDPIRYLVPEPVEAYISKHGLYVGG